jgi:hypothetical protein
MFIKHTLCSSFVIGIISSFLFSSTFFGAVYSQAPRELASQPSPTEWVKIVNPITGQKVMAGQQLEVTGESSDSTSKDCEVSVIVDDVKPRCGCKRCRRTR